MDLANKSQEFEDLYHTISPDASSAAKVPILIDGDVNLIESQIIVEYLASKYLYEGENLLPEDPADLAKAKLFIETFTSSLMGPMFALLGADSQESIHSVREKLVKGLHVLDSALKKHGKDDGGDYFLGKQFSIADVCTVTFLQRALAALPVYRDVDISKLMQEEKLERLERWCKAVLERPSAIETKPADEVIVKSWGKFVAEVK